MIINHNLSAYNTGRILGITGKNNGKLAEKLSSGYRINRSADDSAGLAISEKMRRQIRGLTQATYNVQDGISLVQAAEGALHEMHDMLQRMNELAIQASNDTNSTEEREYLQEEIKELIQEVDKIAATTTFNEQVLLNGKFARQGGGNQTTPKIRIYDLVSYDSVTTTQSTDNFYAAEAGNDVLKEQLKNQIMPNAINGLLATFGDIFGYLDKSMIGIGLRVYDDPGDSTVASVSVKSSYWSSYNPPKVELEYKLEVNTGRVGTPDPVSGELTEEQRRYLESTLVHEMMHGLMFEATTVGMLKNNQYMQYVEGFPLWFIEGMAQAAGGGVEDVRKGLRIDATSSEDAIKKAIERNRLTANTYASNYGTSYLAAMYLGYVVNGSTSMEAADIARGLDVLLNDIRGGKSLNQAIADRTEYSDITDFENRFAEDGSSFSKQLMEAARISDDTYGYGALVGGNYKSTDIIANNNIDENVFKLNTNYQWVNNVYPDDYVVMSGGGKSQGGVAGPDYQASNAPTTGGGTDPTDPDAGGGTGPTNPGTGSGTGPTNPGTGGGNTTPANPTTGGGNRFAGGINIQVGDGAEGIFTMYIEAMSAAELGIDQVNVETREGAYNAIDQVNNAIVKLSGHRSNLGAYQNRLEHTLNNLENVIENTVAAESQIRDSDMAKLMVEYSNNQILLRAGEAMLAQNNKSKDFLLGLFY